METAYTGMVDALGTMIKEEGLSNGGVFEDTREMMIKVGPYRGLVTDQAGAVLGWAGLMNS